MRTRRVLALICVRGLIALAPVLAGGAEPADIGVTREMIDVGDHRLQLVRSGTRGPTVVFEAGMGDKLDRWLPIAAHVAGFSTTVCYSRAGCGKSEPAAYVRTPAAVAAELHVLLERAAAPPPYVLVGHSLGAFYVRAFAMCYPAETAGLVLVDPSSERMVIEMRRLSPERAAKMESQVSAMKGVARLEADGMRTIIESGKFDVPGALPDVPTVLITGTRIEPDPNNPRITEAKKANMTLWRTQHSDFFQHVANGRHIVTPQSGHFIMVDQPDLVVEAIRWIVAAGRWPK